MALFSRSTRDDAADALTLGEDDRVIPSRPRGVGQMLREARQGFGRDVSHVGAALRIRSEYLEAIESGRYKSLPGPTYAVGFIRTYAEYLGLDGAEIVRRFKQETEGLDLKRDLSFPMPLTERSVPGGTILLVALILGLCGYGLWYYVSSANRNHGERVGSVPSDLLPPNSGSAAPVHAPRVAVSPLNDAAAAPATGSAAGSGTATPAIPATPGTATPATPARSIVASAPPASASSLPAPPEPANGGAAPTATVSPAPASSLPPPPETRAASTAGATQPTVEAPTTASPPQVASLPAVPAVSAPPDPSHVFGVAGNAPARIVIRATGTSWIQIRDTQEAQVFTRVMRVGDVYRVPDKPGLLLRTGNAGGLEVSVDGKPAPSLGAVGVIRHTIALDPQKLLAGSAVQE